MKPHERKQLPRNIHNLSLQEATNNSFIDVFIGECKQTFTPFFENGQLVAVFYSWQTKFVESKHRIQSTNNWPMERIYINYDKILRYWRLKTSSIASHIIEQNEMIKENPIDPSRDYRLPWEKTEWIGDASCSNIDRWSEITKRRIEQLKLGTAKTIFDKVCHMEMLGVIIAILACIDKRADCVSYLHEFDEIIGQEADAYLRSGFNYAGKYKVLTKSEIDLFKYPYKDYIHELMVVEIPVPELLHPLLRIGHRAPLHKGITYVGIKKFKSAAKIIFINEWKLFALRALRLFPSNDPAFDEFCQKMKLFSTLDTLPGLKTSASLLFPTISPAAPACMQTLFQKLPLKHYARWQLAEIAVDMKWSLNNLMAHYSDTNINRREVTAAYRGYHKKPPTRNRCKLYMRKSICPYNTFTYRACTASSNFDDSLPPTPIPDIEDLNPAHFFQKRISK